MEVRFEAKRIIKMVFEKFNLFGRTALITGSAGLLGKEHALALLESGASLILTDLSHTNLISLKNELLSAFNDAQIQIFKMDVSDIKDIIKISDEINLKGLRVDILINNAAINPKVEDVNHMLEASRFENFSLENWDTQISVGLTGAFLCSRIFGTLMAKDRKGGVILNISSDLSVIAPDQRLYRKDEFSENMQPVKPVTYSVIKTGLIGLTRYLASYWANKGVRCNALSPGGVFNEQSDDFVLKLVQLIPLGRMANSDEYRSAVQFLCSDASAYLTGQNIVIDGGRSII